MAIGKKRARQQDLWIATNELPRSRGHIFCEWVNKILNGAGFDEFGERECLRFYKSEMMGWPSIAPGAYFRMLLIGSFEGIDSERGIGWRCADSLSLRSPGVRTDGGHTGSLDSVTNAAADRYRDARANLYVDAAGACESWIGRWQDDRSGCDDTGSECRHAIHRSAGHGRKL